MPISDSLLAANSVWHILWKLTPVLISIAVTFLAVVVLFKFVTYRIKRALTKNLPRSDDGGSETLVAGPEDEQQRKERIDKLLIAAELPRLAEIEPLFGDTSGIELLAT